MSMIRRFLHFIQYHNAANALLIGIFVVGAGTAFAATDEDVRQAVADTVIKETQTIVQIDNSTIVDADLDAFDAQLQVLEVQEDDFAYYATYQFSTLAIEDGLWQEVLKNGKMTIDKESLAGGDLGLYLAEELGEVTAQELRYLQEVQEIERKKGSQKKKVATEYSGLIGKLLDVKEETFDGYNPVIEEPEKVEVEQPKQVEIVEEQEAETELDHDAEEEGTEVEALQQTEEGEEVSIETEEAQTEDATEAGEDETTNTDEDTADEGVADTTAPTEEEADEPEQTVPAEETPAEASTSVVEPGDTQEGSETNTPAESETEESTESEETEEGAEATEETSDDGDTEEQSPDDAPVEDEPVVVEETPAEDVTEETE